MSHLWSTQYACNLNLSFSTCPQLCCSCTPKFHHITSFIEYLHWLKIYDGVKNKILSHTYKSLNLLKSALFFHSLHIVELGLLLSPLVALLSPFLLIYRTDLINILLLFCGTVSNLQG